MRVLALACLFAATATPLIVTPWLPYYPYVFGKAVWFRAVTVAAGGLWLALCVAEPRYRPRPTAILAALVGVLLLTAASDATAVFPRIAFLGRRERMDGFVELACVAAYAVIGAALLDTERLRRRLIALLLWVSVLVAAAGFWQHGALVAIADPTAQITSTLGNPVFLAQYAALMVCLAGFYAVRAGSFGRALCVVAAVLNLAMVFLSQGRGAALALGAGGVVAALSWRRHRWMLLGATAVLLAVLVLLPAFDPALPRVRRFTEISLADPRFAVWRLSLAAARQHPLLGWGQDGLLLAGGWRIHFDRAHNFALDWLVSGGLLGLAAWSALLVALWRGIKTTFQGGERVALGAFLTVYLVSDMVLFDTLGTYLLLGTALAITAASMPHKACAQFDMRGGFARY